MKAFWRVLFNLILLSFGVQMVKAEEQEISVHRMIEKEHCPILHAESGVRWMRMEACELVIGVWKRELVGKAKKRKIARREDQHTPVRRSQGKDPRTFKGRSHRAERWRVQKKWQKKKRKRKKKNIKIKRKRKSRWWQRCKERGL